MNTSFRPLWSLLLLACCLATLPVHGASPVTWSLAVPAPATPSNGSTLASITSDAAGNALVIVNVTNTTMVGQFPSTIPVGSQLFLLNPKGKVVGKAEVATTFLTPLFVSAKRVIVLQGSQLVQFAATAQGALVATNLSTQDPAETLVPSTPANQNFKYLHTTLNSGGYLSTIKRYLVTKLAP